MSSFRTEVPVEKPDWAIDYHHSTAMMGSCFAENIGERLIDRKLKVDLNPFGVLFNPVSIASGIQHLIAGKQYSIDDLFVRDGLWHSFDHHSRYSGTDPLEVLDQINKQLIRSAEFIKTADYLFITFGTARVFHHVETGRVVSNCHKVPAAEFEYRLLRIGDIVRLYTRIIQEFQQFNPNLKIVFTVSPVRYWKDGANGNQISKATLLLAVSELVDSFDNVNYFPAYEIFMDDLRDYRFYNEDLIHPGVAGVNYVWNKFIECYFSDHSIQIAKRIEKIQKDRSHIPLNPDSETYRDFQQKLNLKIDSLKSDFPDLQFEFD